MEFTKFQITLLKEKDKHFGSTKKFKYFCGMTEQGELFVTDGSFGYVIPDQYIYIDPKKVFSDQNVEFNLMYLLTPAASEYIDTGKFSMMSDGKTMLHFFANRNTGKLMAISEKYLKMFDIAEDVTFWADDEKKPLQLWWHGNIVGIILPVKMKENKDA